MDIILLIIVWCFILYLVFGNQTKKKYKKGLAALKSRNMDLAENYFQQIIDKHPEAK
jgi:TolA-binding protein